MPIRPSVLKTLKKPVIFTYCGETVSIAYYPAELGDESTKRARELNATMQTAMQANDEALIDDTSRKIAEWVCTWLASWDYMLDDCSAPQPITPENILYQMATFSDFMQTISRVVMTDKNQGNANAPSASGNFGAISQLTEPTVTTTASPTPFASSLPLDGSTEPQA